MTETGQQNLLARVKVKTSAKLAACSINILDMKKLLFDSFRKNRLHYNSVLGRLLHSSLKRLCNGDY